MKLSRILFVAIMLSLAGIVSHAKTKPLPGAIGGEATSAVAAAKVDLNSATQAELEKLPGVGPAIAKKIVAGRPYASAGDLTKAGIPAKTVEKLTPLVAIGTGPAAVKNMATPPKITVPTVPQAAGGVKATKPVVSPPAGIGMVWVNTDSKIYHKQGSKWYGNTKQGSYMTESEAVKAGYRESKVGKD